MWASFSAARGVCWTSSVFSGVTCIEVFDDSFRVPSYLGLNTGVDSVTRVAVDVEGAAAGVANADGVVCGVL